MLEIGTSSSVSMEIVELLLPRVKIVAISVQLYGPYRINSRVGLFEYQGIGLYKMNQSVNYNFLLFPTYSIMSNLVQTQLHTKLKQ
jgi:hypothetical protein